MSLRDDIVNDFAAIADDFEPVSLYSRTDPSADAVVVTHAKRFSVHQEDEDFQALGHYVHDFTMFDMPASELSFDPRLGDVVVQGGRRHVVVNKFESRMTGVVKLKCLELSVVAPQLVDVYTKPLEKDKLGSSLDATRLYAVDVSAKVYQLDALAEDFMGDGNRPTYRVGFFADARSIKLPLPQECVFRTKDGMRYRMFSSFRHEALAGFMVANCVIDDAVKVNSW